MEDQNKISGLAEIIYYSEDCSLQEAINKARKQLGISPYKFKGQEDD